MHAVRLNSQSDYIRAGFSGRARNDSAGYRRIPPSDDPNAIALTDSTRSSTFSQLPMKPGAGRVARREGIVRGRIRRGHPFPIASIYVRALTSEIGASQSWRYPRFAKQSSRTSYLLRTPKATRIAPEYRGFDHATLAAANSHLNCRFEICISRRVKRRMRLVTALGAGSHQIDSRRAIPRRRLFLLSGGHDRDAETYPAELHATTCTTARVRDGSGAHQ